MKLTKTHKTATNVFAGNKAHLPSKLCLTCGRTMTWRKKWEKCWAAVKYCSQRCSRGRA